MLHIPQEDHIPQVVDNRRRQEDSLRAAALPDYRRHRVVDHKPEHRIRVAALRTAAPRPDLVARVGPVGHRVHSGHCPKEPLDKLRVDWLQVGSRLGCLGLVGESRLSWFFQPIRSSVGVLQVTEARWCVLLVRTRTAKCKCGKAGQPTPCRLVGLLPAVKTRFDVDSASRTAVTLSKPKRPIATALVIGASPLPKRASNALRPSAPSRQTQR